MNNITKIACILFLATSTCHTTFSMHRDDRLSNLRIIKAALTEQELLLSADRFSMHDSHSSNPTILAQDQLDTMRHIHQQMALIALISYEHINQATATADRQNEILLKLTNSMHEISISIQAIKKQLASKPEKRDIAIGEDAEEKSC